MFIYTCDIVTPDLNIKSCHDCSHPIRRHPVVRKTLMESQQNDVSTVSELAALKIPRFPTRSFWFLGSPRFKQPYLLGKWHCIGASMMTLGVKYRSISYHSLPQITVSWWLVFQCDLLGIQTLKFSRIQCPPNGRSKSHFEEAGSSGLLFISILFPEFSTKTNMRWMKYDPFTDRVGLFFVQLNACSLAHWKESPNWNVFVEPWYDELCEEWWIGHGSWFLVEGKIATLDLL